MAGRGKDGGGSGGRSPDGRALGGRVRLRNRKGRRAGSARWLERQLNDPYVRAAQQAGYRARAAFKLRQLDDRFQLLRHATRVVDLGTAPGSWAQVVRERRPEATLVGIDLLDMAPVDGLAFVKGDFLADGMDDRLIALLGGKADVVLSDMAANMVGHRQTDYLRTMALVEAAAEFAARVLAPGGHFAAKVLGSGADAALLAVLQRRFASVQHAKPPASRAESSETYVVARDFRGGA